MKKKFPQKIYTDSIHCLDFGAYPPWLNQLYSLQKASDDVQRLAERLLGKINPTDGIRSRLRAVQQYIHDDTYHITTEDRLGLYGYVEFESIPYTQNLIDDAYRTIDAALLAHKEPEERIRWRENKRHRRFDGNKNGPLKKSLKLQDFFRGKPPLQCAEEATLAAALSFYVANISEDKIVFMGSPIHVSVFIRPSNVLRSGCLFDSKMLYFPKDMKRFGRTPEEKKRIYMGLFGKLWFIVNSSRFLNYQSGLHRISEEDETQMIQEIDQFFGII